MRQRPVNRRAPSRRLAYIVAIDVSGYSRQSEENEARATAAVSSLKKVVTKVSRDHKGRVFNSAGDGFMLEFDSSENALKAALEISRNDKPPVRIGIHAGEVVVQPDGDLLGHGVNVAARLMALAKSGSFLVSDDVHRISKGPLVNKLISLGRVRLSKIEQSVEVFGLRSGDLINNAVDHIGDVPMLYRNRDAAVKDMLTDIASARSGVVMLCPVYYSELVQRVEYEAALALAVNRAKRQITVRQVTLDASIEEVVRDLLNTQDPHLERWKSVAELSEHMKANSINRYKSTATRIWRQIDKGKRELLRFEQGFMSKYIPGRSYLCIDRTVLYVTHHTLTRRIHFGRDMPTFRISNSGPTTAQWFSALIQEIEVIQERFLSGPVKTLGDQQRARE